MGGCSKDNGIQLNIRLCSLKVDWTAAHTRARTHREIADTDVPARLPCRRGCSVSVSSQTLEVKC